METTEKKSKDKFYKIIITIMGLLIVVLVWQLIDTKIKVNIFTVEKNSAKTKNQALQHELDSLLVEHDKIKSEYGTLSIQLTEKDSIILAKAEEIQTLIASQADYYSIKKKLNYLRGITQGYISQIDSLYTVNKELKDKNVEITSKYVKEQEKTTELTKDKETLTEKVSLASTLKAYNIKGVPVKSKSGGKKEEIVDKAKKADRIKVSFTLSENLIAPSGNKSVYVRIARPDDRILTIADDDVHSFDYNGQKIQYSVKEDIDYQNKAMDMVTYWDKIDDFTAGTYVVSVFTDGYLIGEAQFILK